MSGCPRGPWCSLCHINMRTILCSSYTSDCISRIPGGIRLIWHINYTKIPNFLSLWRLAVLTTQVRVSTLKVLYIYRDQKIGAELLSAPDWPHLPMLFIYQWMISVYVGKIPSLRHVLLNSKQHFSLDTLAETFSISRTFYFQRSDLSRKIPRTCWTRQWMI